ncbi:ABC transporter ATP-binding protein [Lachnospiraceae bacterium 62-35]
MLKVQGLKKAYGKIDVLDDLNMDVPQGALYGFIGPNGAGKTTAIKIMVGLLKPDEGFVSFGDKRVDQGKGDWKWEVGYVPDSFGVYDNLQVSEYMEFFASCYGIEGLKARKRCEFLLEQVGLEDKISQYVDGLSRGMKQRLCLARALIHDPGFLILDEPSSGLDPGTRLEFKEILMDLKNQGKTILISSHVLSELSELCTDVGIIDKGKILLSGSIQNIMSQVNTSNPLIISIYGGRTERAVALMKSHPYVQTITVKGGDVAVRFSGDDEDETVLLQQLVDADIPVRSFSREKGSLESLFLELTRGGEERTVLKFENQSDM